MPLRSALFLLTLCLLTIVAILAAVSDALAAPATSASPPPKIDWAVNAIEVSRARHVEDLAQGSGLLVHPPVIVAIIDTGADLKHPELASHLWTNPGESGLDALGRDRATNGIDDDRNGFIDDVHGWNFADRSPLLYDSHGHGTHIAGIVTSVAPEARLMVLKYYDPSATDAYAVDNTVRAIEYAVRMGARIINYSAGGARPSPRERAAIEAAGRAGVLFVAAAGNDGRDSDVSRYYPADYGLSNILSVTAIGANGHVLPSSNFGVGTVRIAAPGDAITSTLPGGRHGRMTGTSQATAFATGVAALALQREPAALGPKPEDPSRLIEQLTQSGVWSEKLVGKTAGATSLNAYRVLAIQGPGVAADGIRDANSAAIDPRFFAPAFDTPIVKTASGLP